MKAALAQKKSQSPQGADQPDSSSLVNIGQETLNNKRKAIPLKLKPVKKVILKKPV